MDKKTFTDNFTQVIWLRKTFLCYKVELLEDGIWIPVDKFKGFLQNKGADTLEPPCHAELCFLELIHSWELDRERHYRVTWFISWSPCGDCAEKLDTFLRMNSHVSLRIFAARLYYSNDPENRQRLRRLHEAGVQLQIMSSDDFEYCWETFVDHQGTPFPRWDDLDQQSETLSKTLEGILQNLEN